MAAQDLMLFAGVALLTVATPGPTMLMALANGAQHGLRRAAAGIAGAVLSDGLLVAAVACGLGGLLAASEAAFSAVKWAGVAYLAWLGGSMLCARRAAAPGALAASTDGAIPARAGTLFRQCLLVALGNPKALLFFGALLPPFIDPAAPQAPQYALLGGVFALLDGVVMAAYATAGACTRRRPGSAGGRWFDRACGAALLALAAALAGLRRTAA